MITYERRSYVRECQDEIDADAAAFEAIQEICLESLFDVEPKGDA